ncbi:hypothetical protein [Fluviicola taffensis]|uniref:Membrane protein involved in aromatic hydrocarbon degradation n=1 Tax=Fluviicola taffensis (strain DSM 16823 / NCIMB 13979 / RW262) TaxID=755732 RepID=F2I9Q5_FLUTR|nr:hypothetical protein [Fluviicola taffensis]AEA43051.1 hypothetical protein Fluta_1053 [Fluviicola taffensis DSM 16823]
MKLKNSLPLLICLSLLPFVSSGQDNHYWNDQFGIKATALGGAAVGGLNDYSMVYYNAAAMTLVEKRALSFSMNAYQIRKFKQQNSLGPAQDLQSTEFSVVPNMVAGITSLKKFKKVRVGYMLLSKNVHNSKLNSLHSGRYDVIDLPGEENYVSRYAQEIRNIEYSVGFGISYNATPHLSVGLTHMGIFKGVRYYNDYSITVLPQDTSSSQDTRLSSNITFNYWDVKAMFKPSILIHYPKFRIGFTATLPIFNILGRGTFLREFSTLNLDGEGLLPFDISIASKATKTKVQHKNPASFSLGLSAQISDKVWAHLTAETFLKQNYYLVHNDPTMAQHYPEFISDSVIVELFGGQKFLSYGEGARSVTNIGLGIEVELSERAGIQFGGHTDFNYNKYPIYTFTRQTIQSSQYNRLVFALGGNLDLKGGKRASMVFEFGFALPKTTNYTIDFTTPNVARNGLTGDSAPGVRTQAYSYRVMIELTLGKLLK